MSALTFSNNLSGSKVLAIMLMALTLVLAGCGAGSDTSQTNAQASNEVEGGNDETETDNGGQDDPVDEPETSILNLISQPGDASIAEGESHTFVVMVEHENPITVTWSRNGQVVQRSSSTSLTASAAGKYLCYISDGVSSAQCRSFTLTVTAGQSLSINSQPSNQMVNEGVDVTLSVAASGSGSLSYQWYFDGSALSGATAATLLLDDVTVADAGEYYVVVSNGSGSATSNAATLSVSASLGQALITWNPPQSREDDSRLAASEIQSYEIYYSDSATGTMYYVDSVDGGNLDYTATGLAQGTYYFSLATVDTYGLKSALSSPVSVTIN
ncbi:MAG: immunoglobulin domain-containing protein [Pseudomonadota bacterium]|nr:immunoglobulin domain-containing protein [Pseudomonadota bacterium]